MIYWFTRRLADVLYKAGDLCIALGAFIDPALTGKPPAPPAAG